MKKHDVIIDRLLEDGHSSTDISSALFSMLLATNSTLLKKESPQKQVAPVSRRGGEDSDFISQRERDVSSGDRRSREDSYSSGKPRSGNSSRGRQGDRNRGSGDGYAGGRRSRGQR